MPQVPLRVLGQPPRSRCPRDKRCHLGASAIRPELDRRRASAEDPAAEHRLMSICHEPRSFLSSSLVRPTNGAIRVELVEQMQVALLPTPERQLRRPHPTWTRRSRIQTYRHDSPTRRSGCEPGARPAARHGRRRNGGAPDGLSRSRSRWSRHLVEREDSLRHRLSQYDHATAPRATCPGGNMLTSARLRIGVRTGRP
jgi:hypothetical protein